MIQIFVILSSIFWIISLLGLGCFMSEFIKRYLKNLEIADEFKILYYGILGLLAISTVGTIFNFFLPLNHIFSSIIMATGIILFFVYRKNIISSCRWYNVLIMLLLFSYSAIMSLMKLEAYDTGLYHLQMINWISNYALPFGLANLHGRFGFNSSWFIDASIVYPLKIITKSPFFIINSIIFFFYGTFVFSALTKTIKDRKINFSSTFVLTTFIPWFYCLAMFISSPSPDVPTMLLTLFITFLLIKTFETKNVDYLFVSLAISFYLVTVKLSALPYFATIFLILFLFFIARNKLKNKIKLILENLDNSKYTFISLFLLLMGIPYLIRGIISSGYMAFPLTFGYLNPKWGVPIGDAINMENWIKSWARKPGVNPSEVLGNWDWLNSWLNRIIDDKILVYATLAGFLIIIICIISRKRKDLNIFLIVSFFSFLGCLFWFFTAPDTRFGYGYLFSFFIILISYGIYNFLNKENIIKYFSWLVCVIILLSFFYKNNINFKQIYNTNKIKNITFVENKTRDQVTIYTPLKGDQCFNAPLLCTPSFNKNLKVIFDKNNNPRMFYFEKQ